MLAIHKIIKFQLGLTATGLSITVAGLLTACANNSANSSWMGDNQQLLAHKRLDQIVIPGTHYANAYNLTAPQLVVCQGEKSSTATSNSATVARLLGPQLQQSDLLLDYLNTQDSDILSQLNSGMRYLEIPICAQQSAYYTANYYLTLSVEQVITQIKYFLAANPHEIILLDLDNNLRAEYGTMQAIDLARLHSYLQQKFSPLLIPKQKWQQLTFEKLWKTKQRIIILTANPLLSQYPDIWDKNFLITNLGQAHFTTIKKLTAIQRQLGQIESDPTHKLSLTPIYTWLDPQLNNINQIDNLHNDHLIMDYLYSLPESAPLNIIVSDSDYNHQLIKFTLDRLNFKPLN